MQVTNKTASDLVKAINRLAKTQEESLKYTKEVTKKLEKTIDDGAEKIMEFIKHDLSS